MEVTELKGMKEADEGEQKIRQKDEAIADIFSSFFDMGVLAFPMLVLVAIAIFMFHQPKNLEGRVLAVISFLVTAAFFLYAIILKAKDMVTHLRSIINLRQLQSIVYIFFCFLIMGTLVLVVLVVLVIAMHMSVGPSLAGIPILLMEPFFLYMFILMAKHTFTYLGSVINLPQPQS